MGGSWTVGGRGGGVGSFTLVVELVVASSLFLGLASGTQAQAAAKLRVTKTVGAR